MEPLRQAASFLPRFVFSLNFLFESCVGHVMYFLFKLTKNAIGGGKLKVYDNLMSRLLLFKVSDCKSGVSLRGASVVSQKIKICNHFTVH